MHRHLRSKGIRCSRKRVARLMREEEIRAKKKRRFRVTTDSNHSYPIAPNRLKRRFGVEEVAGTDQVWVSDITYVPTREG